MALFPALASWRLRLLLLPARSDVRDADIRKTPGRHVAAAWVFHQRVGFDLSTESFRARLDRAGALRAELEAVGPAVAVEGWGVATVADEVTYYHLDALGSVRAVSDQTGQVVARHDYRPFGEEVAPEAGVDPRRFTGKERDAETGLDYFGARYYRATAGRFTTIDPVYTWQETLADPQRWNRYAYVRNNPLRYVDPDGKAPVPLLVTAAIGAAVYGGWAIYQNVSHGQSWYNNLGAEASKGFVVGATLGVVAPALVGHAASAAGFSAGAIDTVIQSSRRAASPQISEGARAIAKKLGHAAAQGFESAFKGTEPTQQNAESLISSILPNPAKTVVLDKYIDVYNKAGQGLRIDKATGQFVTLLEGSLPK